MKLKVSILLIWLLPLSILTAQNSGSLFSDIKAQQVGDVLSVILAESAYAAQESKSNSESNSDTKINASASGNIASFLPVFGGNGSLESRYKGSQGTQQKDKLTGRLTVRITENM